MTTLQQLDQRDNQRGLSKKQRHQPFDDIGLGFGNIALQPDFKLFDVASQRSIHLFDVTSQRRLKLFDIAANFSGIVLDRGNIALGGKIAFDKPYLLVGKRFGLRGREPGIGQSLDEFMGVERNGFHDLLSTLKLKTPLYAFKAGLQRGNGRILRHFGLHEAGHMPFDAAHVGFQVGNVARNGGKLRLNDLQVFQQQFVGDVSRHKRAFVAIDPANISRAFGFGNGSLTQRPNRGMVAVHSEMSAGIASPFVCGADQAAPFCAAFYLVGLSGSTKVLPFHRAVLQTCSARPPECKRASGLNLICGGFP